MTRVGVTGHTGLTGPTRALVYDALLAALKDHLDGEALWGVTCLADGADQLFARAVLAVDGRFEVVLPAADYRERVVTAQNLPDFDDLLHEAASVSYMPFGRANRRAYAAASAEMLRRCDVVLAVWDGEPSRRLGDTAHVVATARRLGRPVVVCWPAGALREQPVESDVDSPLSGSIAVRPGQCTVRKAAPSPQAETISAASGSRVRAGLGGPSGEHLTGPSEERVLYFFLSYARGDDDVYVEKFYRDLCAEVRVRTGIGREIEVGFFDNHSIGLGAPWSERLIDALSRCRAFLALCSPAYFLSEACGKEWAVFADRLRLYQQTTGFQPPALMPLVWFPARTMPPVAEAIQYRADVLGDVYNRDGLRQLIRLQRNRDAYLEFVSAVAEQVVSTAYAHDVPRPPRYADFHRIPSMFHNHTQPELAARPVSQATGEATELVSPTGPGSHFVHFVVVSAARAQMASVRQNLSLYGARAQDWAPYGPAQPMPLGDLACQIAAERSFQSGVVDADGLISLIDKANELNHIVVLLVDAWAIPLAQHDVALAAYDRRNEPTTAVMIPCSLDDEETRREWGKLAAALRTVFLNHSLGRDDVMFRSSVLTQDAFEADLQVVLEVAKNRLFVRGTVFRRPPGDHAGDRPILNGP
jgi:FxsC-like protein